MSRDRPTRMGLQSRRRTRRRLGGALITIATISGGGLTVGGVIASASKRATLAAKTSGAATVQRRSLIATDIESGTLQYADPQTVYNRLGGTVTWLPTVGQRITPGQTLYKIDGQPVVLFDGRTPAYRDLASGISDGADVEELNRDLVNMGFAKGEITINDTWQAGTTDAIERWQASRGETETGTIPLGQAVFLHGARLVASIQTTLGSSGQAVSPATPRQGSEQGSQATGAGGTQSILQTTGDQLVAVVPLDATKQYEATVGEPVTVEMPNGTTIPGKITLVSPVAQATSSNGASGGSSPPPSVIPVTIALKGRFPKSGLDQAAVSVNFAKQKANDVLSVPVTALIATAGGGYALQPAADPRRLIPVTPGLFGAGYVQITGAQVTAGLQVTTSQG